jgi:hypothetical protein
MFSQRSKALKGFKQRILASQKINKAPFSRKQEKGWG